MGNIGIDLVNIADFQNRLKQSGGVEMIFTDTELIQNQKVESLAGIFAAKEAFMKAVARKIDWHEAWIEKMPSGQPIIASTVLPSNQKASVSISHDGAYAIAVVLISN